MPEYRQNLATKEWVVLATERAKRPSDFRKKEKESKEPTSSYNKKCPFCKGNEAQTTESLYAYPSESDWQVRAVANKYAALDPSLSPKRMEKGAFLAVEGFGRAEVVIEHPQHNANPATMSQEEIINILKAYRSRQFELSKDDKINLVTIFRNHGYRAGTSLIHPHSQIIATPIVPPHVRDPMRQAVLYFDTKGECVYCKMVNEELKQKERIIFESNNFVAFCPYAARSPFECRIYPKRHMASYIWVDDDEIADLAEVLRLLLSALYFGLDDPDYNYIIRSSPVGDENTRHLHWYMVIVPKISIPAGFEIGSGIYINSMAPETCASFLRENGSS